jgi:hypothetical protein
MAAIELQPSAPQADGLTDIDELSRKQVCQALLRGGIELAEAVSARYEGDFGFEPKDKLLTQKVAATVRGHETRVLRFPSKPPRRLYRARSLCLPRPRSYASLVSVGATLGSESLFSLAWSSAIAPFPPRKSALNSNKSRGRFFIRPLSRSPPDRSTVRTPRSLSPAPTTDASHLPECRHR